MLDLHCYNLVEVLLQTRKGIVHVTCIPEYVIGWAFPPSPCRASIGHVFGMCASIYENSAESTATFLWHTRLAAYVGTAWYFAILYSLQRFTVTSSGIHYYNLYLLYSYIYLYLLYCYMVLGDEGRHHPSTHRCLQILHQVRQLFPATGLHNWWYRAECAATLFT